MNDWIVQLKGDLSDTSTNYELSIVHKDNELGQDSWYWHGTHKLAVCSVRRGLTINPNNEEAREHMLKVAQAMCDGLNAVDIDTMELRKDEIYNTADANAPKWWGDGADPRPSAVALRQRFIARQKLAAELRQRREQGISIDDVKFI